MLAAFHPMNFVKSDPCELIEVSLITCTSGLPNMLHDYLICMYIMGDKNVLN